MTVIINGTTGITNVNGSAAAPAETGTDTDTGIVYGTNTVTIATNGTAGLNQDASQNAGIGGSPSAWGAAIRAFQVKQASFRADSSNNSFVTNNAYYDGTNYRYINTGATAQEMAFYQGSAYLSFATSGTAGNVVSFTQGFQLGKGTTLALEGATSQSGTGISFPSTQNASSDANTLDDYEEGTWTPTVTFDSGPSSITYTSQVARYTKIGNTVNVWFYVQVNTVSGAGGSSYISGLPFTCNGTVQGGVNLNWSNNGFVSTVAFAGHIPVSQARAYLVYLNGGATSQLPSSQVTTSTQIIMAGSYQV